MENEFDFSGYATRNDLLCGDGRTIKRNAFKDNDGGTVPLVWNHDHTNPDAVLGHALLENRDDGVYAYCKFNDTESGKQAKELVQHGDVRSLSIWANKLKQIGNDVIHGTIRELSLVLAGANPGAYIDFVMAHGDDEEDGLYANYDESALVIYHSDTSKKGEKEEMAEDAKKTADNAETKDTKTGEKKTIQDVIDSMTKEQLNVMYALIGQALEEGNNPEEKKSKKEVKHSEKEDGDKTIQEVIDSMNEEQKNVLYALVGQALEYEADDEDDMEHSEGGENFMKKNIFDQENGHGEVLSHSEMAEILEEARKGEKRLSDVVLSHGITQIETLFPDSQMTDATPAFIKRDDTWVADVMNAVHKTPFSRVKSVFADLTEADARAKGYLKKGTEKVEEFFTLLKRETTPTTIYKKQAIDRDDAIDVTDFDVVAWLKLEMRMMLEEEIARAVLVGDGRSSSSNDKINEQNVRPIWTDDDVYTVKAAVNITDATTDDEKAKGFIKSCIKSRKNYKGSGNPVMYISEDMLTNCLLLEDTNGRIIYDSIDKLATALRVKKIVPVPVMENLTRTVESNTHTLAGIYVNLADYNIGADKGGAVNMFDDFDIDYNKQKYLIETRCSGALVKPYSAVAIEFVKATA